GVGDIAHEFEGNFAIGCERCLIGPAVLRTIRRGSDASPSIQSNDVGPWGYLGCILQPEADPCFEQTHTVDRQVLTARRGAPTSRRPRKLSTTSEISFRSRRPPSTYLRENRATAMVERRRSWRARNCRYCGRGNLCESRWITALLGPTPARLASSGCCRRWRPSCVRRGSLAIA